MMIAPETAFGKARVILDRMVAFVEQASKDEVRTDCVERELFVMLLEMGRQLLTAFFAMAGDGNVGESWSWKGQTLWKLQDLKKKTYRSIFGVIGLFRHVYAVREGQESSFRRGSATWFAGRRTILCAGRLAAEVLRAKSLWPCGKRSE